MTIKRFLSESPKIPISTTRVVFDTAGATTRPLPFDRDLESMCFVLKIRFLFSSSFQLKIPEHVYTPNYTRDKKYRETLGFQ